MLGPYIGIIVDLALSSVYVKLELLLLVMEIFLLVLTDTCECCRSLTEDLFIDSGFEIIAFFICLLTWPSGWNVIKNLCSVGFCVCVFWHEQCLFRFEQFMVTTMPA